MNREDRKVMEMARDALKYWMPDEMLCPHEHRDAWYSAVDAIAALRQSGDFDVKPLQEYLRAA